jgi:hypothetical protein
MQDAYHIIHATGDVGTEEFAMVISVIAATTSGGGRARTDRAVVQKATRHRRAGPGADGCRARGASLLE